MNTLGHELLLLLFVVLVLMWYGLWRVRRVPLAAAAILGCGSTVFMAWALILPYAALCCET